MRHRLDLVVGDEDGRDAERLDAAARNSHAHQVAQLGVEVGQRLVEQQQVRLVHQRAGQRHPLLLAAAQQRRRAIGQMAELHARERLAHPRRDVGALDLARPVDAAERRRCRTPSCAARSRRTGTPCRGRAGSAARRCPRRPTRPSAPPMTMRPALGRLEPGDALQRRGLAAAGRAEQREELALGRPRTRRRSSAGGPADPRAG